MIAHWKDGKLVAVSGCRAGGGRTAELIRSDEQSLTHTLQPTQRPGSAGKHERKTVQWPEEDGSTQSESTEKQP